METYFNLKESPVVRSTFSCISFAVDMVCYLCLYVFLKIESITIMLLMCIAKLQSFLTVLF